MAVPGFGHCRFDKMICMELLRQYLAEIRTIYMPNTYLKNKIKSQDENNSL